METYNYSATLGGKPPEQQPQPPMQMIQMHPDLIRVQCINAAAEARLKESHLWLNGLAEIRCALNMPSVSDNGSPLGERQPLEKMFDEAQVMQLRDRYLAMLEGFIRYIDHQEEQLIQKPRQ